MGNAHGRSSCSTLLSASSHALSNENGAEQRKRPSITITIVDEGSEQHSPTASGEHQLRPTRSTTSVPEDLAPLVALMLRPAAMSRSRSLSPIAPPLQRYSRHTTVKVTSNKLLTTRQRRVICDSWRLTIGRCRADRVCFGMLVFRQLCEESTQFKLLFDLSVDRDLTLMHSQHPFVRHARIFANMIDLTVRNIDELEVQITPALFVYGRRHFYKMSDGFNSKMVETFTQRTVQTVCDALGGEYTAETVDAWEQLMEYVLSKLKEGYDFESIHSKKSRLSQRFGDLFAL
uniref:Globin family profile domain-containing protein n=1 Tax=Plectus sambesii TaxID=2011161 RepID=A0A914V8Z5_9BILA